MTMSDSNYGTAIIENTVCVCVCVCVCLCVCLAQHPPTHHVVSTEFAGKLVGGDL